MRYLLFIAAFILISLNGLAQDYNLAQNYFDQGEYEKAESVYKKLYERNSFDPSFLFGLVSSLQQQEKYTEAGEYLLNFNNLLPGYPGLDVEIGHNYSLQGDTERAASYYRAAIENVENNFTDAQITGETFQKYHLLDQAAQTFEIALQYEPNTNLIMRLAQVYGEQGKLEKMYDSFLDIIREEMRFYYLVNREFSKYVNDDPDNEANKMLKRNLIKRLQDDPDVVYNQVLSWLYVQENDFKKAFVQEKAIYQREQNPNLNKIIRLAQTAADKDAFEAAEEMLNYSVENAKTSNIQIRAYTELMKVKVSSTSPKNYGKLKKEFQTIFDEEGKEKTTLDLQLLYAQFLAFKMRETEEAKQDLKELLEKRINRFEEARVKMQLADILVAEEKFNQALIYYSQIKGLVANSPLAQEALFKVAQTSYYKGDFDWAQTQLKVLKGSTSELTANDAIALDLLIEDNISYDSTQTALKLFAKADLLAMQEKHRESLALLDTILVHNEGKRIEAEALLRSAKINEKLQNYEEAETAYLLIIEKHGKGVLADDAYYFLAELYRTKLNDPEKAMDNYKKIIFDHADSIFFVDARKKFRQLRGDDVIQ